jgi:signal transduction histidine kinase
MPMRRSTLVDALVAGAFIIVGQLVAWKVLQDSNVSPHGSRAVQSLLYLCFDALVFFWRRAPLPALLAMGPIGIVQTWLGGTSSFLAGFIAVIFVLFGVASRKPLGVTIAAAAYVLLVLIGIINRSDDLHYGAELPFAIVIIAIAVSLGTALRLRGAQARSALARADELEAARERVLAQERARIARELHDVIAHSVSVMIVQAGAARMSLNGGSPQASESILAVERAGRQALDEMRRLLGILRQGSAEPQLSPQPGLGDLVALVEQVRAAGLPVELELVGEPLQLAPGVDLTAYRIAQEALTNAIKHAGPTTAQLRISYAPEAVEVEVLDHGRGGRASVGGHGLVGMHERVELYRGTLEVGPRPNGGFRVHARLPLGPA